MESMTGNINRNQAGVSLIETIVAFGILSIIAVAFLSGLITSLSGTITAKEQVVAESLARSQLEYIKVAHYSLTYSVSPYLDLPEGWSIPAPLVEEVTGTNGELQKISVTPEYNGEPVLSISTYKLNR